MDRSLIQSLANNIVPMIEGFAWHRGVMEGIAALQLSKLAADKSPASQKRIYDALLPNLFSEDSLLRMSSLQIASSLFPVETTPVAADLIGKCIEVEEMPLSVQGAREKSMKLRKLGIVANGQLGRDGEDVKPALDVVLRYITGQFPLSTFQVPRFAEIQTLKFAQLCSKSVSSLSGLKRFKLWFSSLPDSPPRSGKFALDNF